MFDKLIVCEPEGANFKDRRSYFMVSSLVVGILFLTAVVISIYASDFGLGRDGLELTELIAPPEMAAAEPEPVQPRNPATQSSSQIATRTTFIAPIDQPTDAPPTISTAPNKVASLPKGMVELGPVNSGNNGGGRDIGDPAASDPPGLTPEKRYEATPTEATPPPTLKRNPPIQSLGVITGKASYLPKPAYSAAAIAVHAQGAVDVQVTIDEGGKVISAKAVSGHLLLRDAAEKAAWNARFTPTYLSKVAVKVTGVIVYNFVR